jgi:hypothetical protein
MCTTTNSKGFSLDETEAIVCRLDNKADPQIGLKEKKGK